MLAADIKFLEFVVTTETLKCVAHGWAFGIVVIAASMYSDRRCLRQEGLLLGKIPLQTMST